MERDSIIMATMEKDSSLSEYLESMSEIESNLDSITRSQMTVAREAGGKTELSQNIRDRINYNIEIIGELLQRNNEIISSLNEKLSGNDRVIAALRKRITELTLENSRKDQEIIALKEETDNLRVTIETINRSLDSLYVETKQRDVIIGQKTSELNTAYWVMGTYKELNGKQILKREGGFLGLGKGKVVDNNVNTDAFSKIDITGFKQISVNAKSAVLVTSHPADSYRISKDVKGFVKSIEITDPARFWRSSKYLVIVTG